MREAGRRGAVRGGKVVTTAPGTARPCPHDKANRGLHADRPNLFRGEPLCAIGSRTMASDVAMCPPGRAPSRLGAVLGPMAHWPPHPSSSTFSAAFGRCLRPVAASCRTLGWRVFHLAGPRVVLDAPAQAIRQRKPAGSKSLIHRPDRGSRDLSIRHAGRLADADIDPSLRPHGARFPRRRAGRERHGPFRNRGHQGARVMEKPPGRRVGDHAPGRPVQHRAPARRHRLHALRRGRAAPP